MLSGEGYGRAGLIPTRGFVNLFLQYEAKLPNTASRAAIFGLLEPMPKAWCRSMFHDGEPLLETIVRRIEATANNPICLLQAFLQDDDEAYVMSYGSHLRPGYEGQDGANRRIVKQVKRDYWASRIPMQRYSSHTLQYTIPEVVCFSPIPMQRVKLVQCWDKRDLINVIRTKAGLNPHPLPRPSVLRKQTKMLEEISALPKPSEMKPSRPSFRVINGGRTANSGDRKIGS